MGPSAVRRELTSHQAVVEDTFSPADLPGTANEVALALKWTALTPGRTADAILALNSASDFGEFRTAAVWFEVPSQNLLYADVDGHIGYQMPGRIPVRGSRGRHHAGCRMEHVLRMGPVHPVQPAPVDL